MTFSISPLIPAADLLAGIENKMSAARDRLISGPVSTMEEVMSIRAELSAYRACVEMVRDLSKNREDDGGFL